VRNEKIIIFAKSNTPIGKIMSTAAIKHRIALSMNGICAESIRNSSLEYKKSFGVDWVRLREIAGEFEKSYDDARELWLSEVREHKLVAAAVCPPSEMTEERMKEWMEGVFNTELAEILSFALLSKCEHLKSALMEMEESEEPLRRYTAYHALGRMKNFTHWIGEEEKRRIVEGIKECDRGDMRFVHVIESLEGC